jgi:hypothetical protein
LECADQSTEIKVMKAIENGSTDIQHTKAKARDRCCNVGKWSGLMEPAMKEHGERSRHNRRDEVDEMVRNPASSNR